MVSVATGRRYAGYPPAYAKLEAAPGLPYQGAFTGKSVGASARTELGLAHYTQTLAPGEAMTLVFKMPHFPVAPKESAYLAAADRADYDRLSPQDYGLLGKRAG